MKSTKKLFLIILAALSISMVCPNVVPATNNVTVTEAAKISKKKATLLKGQTLTLKVKGTRSKVKWSSNKKSVATVSSKGKVKAKKKGKATITAKVGKKRYKCVINVETPKISKKSVSIKSGQSLQLKVNGTKQKVSWKSSQKSIATVSSSGLVTAKKAGNTTITATVSKKKYTCKVSVSGADKQTKPLSAYNAYTTDIYSYNNYLGKFKIQLLEYKDGKEAYKLLEGIESNTIPTSNQEYIYIKFKIDYISGSEKICTSRVIPYQFCLYNSASNTQLENLDTAYFLGDVDDLRDVDLLPGQSTICSEAILIEAGNTPITYRLQTGFDYDDYDETYTWFTTQR